MSIFRKRKFSISDGEDNELSHDNKKFASRHTFKPSSESMFYMKSITQLQTKIGLLESEVKKLKYNLDAKTESTTRIETKIDNLDHKITQFIKFSEQSSQQKTDTTDIVDTIIEQLKSIDIFEKKDKKEPACNHQMSYIN